jgi:septum formation protein
MQSDNLEARLILGSQSPRRKEILSYFSIPFQQATSAFDENSVLFHGQPEAYACAIAKGKADALHAKYPDKVILTADTVVFCKGKIYGKPNNESEAYQFFSELVGTWHTVFTGVVVRYEDKEYIKGEATRVLFNDLTPDQIKHYLSRVEWADKAGGYAIQAVGGLIVSRIDGCYYNVMGLPINTVHTLLNQVGINLWNYIGR